LTPAEQAAIVAAQQTASATWAVFWATVAMVVVTIGAVVTGGLAAWSALQALRLESEPVLAITPVGDTPNRRTVQLTSKFTIARDLSPLYVIDWKAGDEKALTLRSEAQDRASGPYPPVTMNFQIQNVGRSPAVGITIPVSIEASTLDLVGGEPSPRAVHGSGSIIIDAIGPGGNYYIRIRSLLRISATLRPEAWGSQVIWGDKKRVATKEPRRRTIPVISLAIVFPADA
jgi:hypothetical protein